jgi:hypothetical protein
MHHTAVLHPATFSTTGADAFDRLTVPLNGFKGGVRFAARAIWERHRVLSTVLGDRDVENLAAVIRFEDRLERRAELIATGQGFHSAPGLLAQPAG